MHGLPFTAATSDQSTKLYGNEKSSKSPHLYYLSVVWSDVDILISGGIGCEKLGDRGIVDVVFIIALNRALDTFEFLREPVLGGGVEHLGANLGRFRGPGDEQDLVLHGALVLKGKIIGDVAAIVLGEGLDHLVPIGLGIGCAAGRFKSLLHLNLCCIISDLKDDRTVLAILD